MYSIQELARESGYAPKTIHKFVYLGILPRAVLAGPHSAYPPEALHRLREIREYRDRTARTLRDWKDHFSPPTDDEG